MRDRTSQGDGPGWAARVLETPLLVLGAVQNPEVLEGHGGSLQLLLLWGGGMAWCLMRSVQWER